MDVTFRWSPQEPNPVVAFNVFKVPVKFAVHFNAVIDRTITAKFPGFSEAYSLEYW